MTRADKVLVLLLRFLGVGSLLALVPVFMPFAWMAATHRWLGLGEMPAAPVVEYLARSVSAFYALVGALCLLVAADLDRYRPLVRSWGWRSPCWAWRSSSSTWRRACRGGGPPPRGRRLSS